jgi:hypothetical protein
MIDKIDKDEDIYPIFSHSYIIVERIHVVISEEKGGIDQVWM